MVAFQHFRMSYAFSQPGYPKLEAGYENVSLEFLYTPFAYLSNEDSRVLPSMETDIFEVSLWCFAEHCKTASEIKCTHK